MDNGLLTARVSEFALSVTRTYLNGQHRTAERDFFYFHVLDVVHNVPMWLVREHCDPYEMLLQYIGQAPDDVRSWFQAKIDRLVAEDAANTAGQSSTVELRRVSALARRTAARRGFGTVDATEPVTDDSTTGTPTGPES